MPCNYIQNSIIKQNLFIGNYNNNEDKGYNLIYKIDTTKKILTSSKKLKIIQVFKNDLSVILNVNIKLEIDLLSKKNIIIELESSI